MADEQNKSPEQDEPASSSPPSAPEPSREVTVSHLDSPPKLGKERIHPRRPAPIVPTREERINGSSEDDPKSE